MLGGLPGVKNESNHVSSGPDGESSDCVDPDWRALIVLTAQELLTKWRRGPALRS
jgi:hypothetical protein